MNVPGHDKNYSMAMESRRNEISHGRIPNIRAEKKSYSCIYLMITKTFPLTDKSPGSPSHLVLPSILRNMQNIRKVFVLATQLISKR